MLVRWTTMDGQERLQEVYSVKPVDTSEVVMDCPNGKLKVIHLVKEMQEEIMDVLYREGTIDLQPYRVKFKKAKKSVSGKIIVV